MDYHKLLKLSLFFSVSLCFFGQGTVLAKDSAIIIFDGSGSMWGQVDGKHKIEIAREVMGTLIKDWNEDISLGLMAYGHREKGNCDDIEMLFPVGSPDRKKMLDSINKLSPKGKTPISQSLQQAAEKLRYTEDPATVILISDGEESCDADPCVVSKELEDKGINFTAHVIGFDVKGNEKAREQLQCIAKNTGGQFYEAEDAGELAEAIIQVQKEVEDPRPTLCKKYAEESVQHEQINLEKECGFTREHWHDDFDNHYKWCIEKPVDSGLISKNSLEKDKQLNGCINNKNTQLSGTLVIQNSKEEGVGIVDQKTGKNVGNYWTYDSSKQLPAGTYKLVFNTFSIDDVNIEAGKKNVFDVSQNSGWLLLKNFNEPAVDIINKKTGRKVGNYWTYDSSKQLAAGLYILKFAATSIDNVEIKPGKENIIDVNLQSGWLFLKNFKDPAVDIIDQKTGKKVGNYWTYDSSKQLAAGLYKLESRSFSISDVRIESGKKTSVDINSQ